MTISISLHHATCLAVVIFATCHMYDSARFISNTFSIQFDNNGQKVCSVDTPTTVIQMESNDLTRQCGVECSASLCCSYYQFKSDTAQCELYASAPANFAVIQGCTGHLLTERKWLVSWRMQDTWENLPLFSFVWFFPAQTADDEHLMNGAPEYIVENFPVARGVLRRVIIRDQHMSRT